MNLYQIASRVQTGSVMQRRRQFQLHHLPRAGAQQKAFDAQLHGARGKQPGAEMAPASEIKEQTPEMEPADIAPTNDEDRTNQAAQRTAWRNSYLKAFRFLRKKHPEVGQSQIGWVMTQVGRALVDDPNMAKRDLKDMVTSLVAGAPDYEQAA